MFAPGETRKTISVEVVGDTAYEANEYFYLDLLSAKGADIVLDGAESWRFGTALVTLRNDDVMGGKNQQAGIYGTSGIDKLGGTAHDDIIDGRGGVDSMSGLAGADVFALAASYAAKLPAQAARILDFKDGTDLLCLRGGLKAADLVVRDLGPEGASIEMANGDTVAVLVGVKAGAIDAVDFVSLA